MNCRLVGTMIFLLGTVQYLMAQPVDAVGHWSFDGDLRDQSGHGNDVYLDAAEYTPGKTGNALKLSRKPAVVLDSVDLRLTPGLRLDCWVKFASLRTGREIVVKKNEYMLRVNPDGEGGGFAFFAYMDGWEPRACSREPVTLGVWHHVTAGWDGKEIWLAVDGKEFRSERPGMPAPTGNPLVIGPVDGAIDELRVENPQAKTSGVAYWPFDGDLRDVSGHGHDIEAEGAVFAAGRSNQALALGAEELSVPDHPDFQLAPGFRIECSAYFTDTPTDTVFLVQKLGEYQLRVDPPKEGGRLAFFVNLGGWEPRVGADQPLKTGVWYRIIAQWDGRSLTLDVNGRRTRSARSGTPAASLEPLTIGAFPGRIDGLRIENPRLPVVRVRDLLQEHAILRAGRPEKLTAVIENCGSDVQDCSVSLQLRGGVECRTPTTHELGALPTGARKTVEWIVFAPREVSVAAALRLTGKTMAPLITARTLAFLPATDPVSGMAAVGFPATPRATDATTYYVDGVGGSNANSGVSANSAWRDFTNINGKTLGPGERLLINRGSVINQELVLSAAGTVTAWAEIGAYGTGPRPAIRRNWDIDERCALIRSPDYLRIRGLVFSHAAQGLVVNYEYKRGDHAGLVIEDCIAHHIEGLYRPNANGIPEWRDRTGPEGAALKSSAGIAIVGANAKDLLVRDCEVFQCSWGFFIKGENVIVDRVYCHDNYTLNTSPHPALIAVRRSYLQNSVFDAPGYHASAGTMGIMIVDPRGLVIRNCIFRNQPDSGSHDEGGIDFEAAGNGCLVDRCTFQNNAGAGIEVLGLKAPQVRNLEISRCRFIQNNVARKLGPSEIYIWGKSPNPEVCCSTGSIHDNGYVTNPGIEFFVNEAPKLTSWTLRDNTQYASEAELREAMPYNDPPTVGAGEDIRTDQRRIQLTGVVQDKQPLKVAWEVLEGPGTVTFQDASTPGTSATFATPGDYLLRLVADDGELWLSDMVTVHILPAKATVAKAWEFNTPLDKEGWTEANTGTRLRHWQHPTWPTRSEPVKYVAGGDYIVAVEDSKDACLLSADDLGVDLAANRTLKIRFQNHTPATRMRFRFTTEANPAWQEANSKSFVVVANDNGPREYTVDLATVPGWAGRLKQLRLDLATGNAITGTCRIDYIWIGDLPRR